MTRVETRGTIRIALKSAGRCAKSAAISAAVTDFMFMRLPKNMPAR